MLHHHTWYYLFIVAEVVLRSVTYIFMGFEQRQIKFKNVFFSVKIGQEDIPLEVNFFQKNIYIVEFSLAKVCGNFNYARNEVDVMMDERNSTILWEFFYYHNLFHALDTLGLSAQKNEV